MTVNLDKLFVIDIKASSWLPFLFILTTTLRMCIAFSDLGMLPLSYAILAINILAFAVMLFFYTKQGFVSHYIILVSLFQLLLLSITIITGMDIKDCLYWGCECVLISLIMEYYHGKFNIILISFAIAFSLCAYLNILHIITHPQLWFVEEAKKDGGYLLGNSYNQMGCRLLFAVISSCLCQKISKWWAVNTFFVIIASISALMIVRSMTSLTCIILFSVICFIPFKQILRLSILGLFVFFFLFQIFVCFYGTGLENNEFATYFIEDVLDKNITFTNRTEMWDSSAKTFLESPVWGHGLVDGEWYLSHMNSTASGPHNLIYSILIYGGIILLILFSYLFWYSIKGIILSLNRYHLLILASIGVYLIMSTMEVYPYTFTLYLLALAYYVSLSYSGNS